MGSFTIWHWIIMLFVLTILFAPTYFYIRTYQSVSREINSKGGNAPIGSAWLLFIPIFSIAWFFVLLIKLKDALAETGMEPPNKAWWNYGIIAGVLYIGSFVGGGTEHALSAIIVIAWLVFAILHWVELANLAKRLQG